MRRSSGYGAGSISIPLITSTSTYDTSTQGSRGIYLGNVYDDPDLLERFGLAEGGEDDLEDEDEDDEEEDYSRRVGYRPGRSGLDGYVTMPSAMLSQPRRQSRAAAARMTGDPSAFLSSPGAGGVGALFIDTDGLRVQHGDDS